MQVAEVRHANRLLKTYGYRCSISLQTVNELNSHERLVLTRSNVPEQPFQIGANLVYLAGRIRNFSCDTQTVVHRCGVARVFVVKHAIRHVKRIKDAQESRDVPLAVAINQRYFSANSRMTTKNSHHFCRALDGDYCTKFLGKNYVLREKKFVYGGVEACDRVQPLLVLFVGGAWKQVHNDLLHRNFPLSTFTHADDGLISIRNIEKYRGMRAAGDLSALLRRQSIQDVSHQALHLRVEIEFRLLNKQYRGSPLRRHVSALRLSLGLRKQLEKRHHECSLQAVALVRYVCFYSGLDVADYKGGRRQDHRSDFRELRSDESLPTNNIIKAAVYSTLELAYLLSLPVWVIRSKKR